MYTYNEYKSLVQQKGEIMNICNGSSIRRLLKIKIYVNFPHK